MGLFGKKKTEKVEVSSLVKILGSGCAKCNTLEDNIVEALKMLGKEMPRTCYRFQQNCRIWRYDNPCIGI